MLEEVMTQQITELILKEVFKSVLVFVSSFRSCCMNNLFLF